MSNDQAAPLLTFILRSSDGVEISVEEDVTSSSKLLNEMISNLGITDPTDPRLQEPLPVTTVDGWTLQKLIDWCLLHRGEVYQPKAPGESPRVELTEEDVAYMAVSSAELMKMLLAADYLVIQALIDIITQQAADMAIGLSVEEVRAQYGMENDWSPEEEEQARMKNEWKELQTPR